MTRRPWFESHEAAARVKAGRLAGGGPVPVPPTLVNRSVHMRPAETPHPSAIERARGAVADRVDTAIARSVRWLLSRSGR